MNKEKIERFDTEYFKKLNEEDKEKYFLQYIKKAFRIIYRGGDRNVN